MKKNIFVNLLLGGVLIGQTLSTSALDFVIFPILTVVTPVPAETYDTTPDFTFSSTHDGILSYQGDCKSLVTSAVKGENKITFDELSYGVHNNCKITVTTFPDGVSSPALEVPSFEVKMPILLPPAIETLPPTLTLITGVTSPTEDSTPGITFHTDEAGKLSYEGSCFSKTTDAVLGNNTITFEPLSAGTYNNCKIRVTDWAGNVSSALSIPSFTVIVTLDPGALKCSGFSDILVSDPDCEAITYVKSIGAITGNPDGTFAPNGFLQRDQIAKIALQTFKKFDVAADYCAGVNPFPDVTKSDWAYQYICRAKALSVVTGYAAGDDAGFFRPARAVNRAEFLALLLRNLAEEMPSGSSYVDVSAEAWYSGYAKYSKDNNLFTGTNLNAGAYTSRREVAQIIFKLNKLGKI